MAEDTFLHGTAQGGISITVTLRLFFSVFVTMLFCGVVSYYSNLILYLGRDVLRDCCLIRVSRYFILFLSLSLKFTLLRRLELYNSFCGKV